MAGLIADEGYSADPARLARRLDIDMSRLARICRVEASTLANAPGSDAARIGLEEIATVLARAAELSGDERIAVTWFRDKVIPGWGATAAELVERGLVDQVLEDLDRMEAGVYS